MNKGAVSHINCAYFFINAMMKVARSTTKKDKRLAVTSLSLHPLRVKKVKSCGSA